MANTTRLQWAAMSAEELEWHFNPRHTVTNSDRYGSARDGLNRAALAERRADIQYGHQPMQDLDIYLPSTKGPLLPVHVFIHGGYWRSRVKEDFAFIGSALSQHGILSVIINYPLCPVVTLDGVVASAQLAIHWIQREISSFGGDPQRISLSGHSSGAHLVAAILSQDAAGEGEALTGLSGAVLISGIYDPAPARRISVNVELRLDEGLCERHNYLSVPRRISCPARVLFGAEEPSGWAAQSLAYAEHAAVGHRPVACISSAGENHFSILDQFLQPESDILSAVLDLVSN